MSMPVDSRVPLIVFCHLPKTGGSTMRRVFREAFGDGFSEVRRKVGAAEEDLTRQKLHRGGGFPETARAVGGHIEYEAYDPERQPRDMIVVSVMREPLSRVLSTYNYIQTNARHPFHPRFVGRDLLTVLEEFPRFLRKIGNRQTRMLFGDGERPTIDRILARDKYVVGKLEHLAAFQNAVSEVVPGDFTAAPRANVARDPNYKDRIRAQPGFVRAVEIVREQTAQDLAFYESFGEVLVSEPMRRWFAARPARAA
jgi:hypothetical protein